MFDHQLFSYFASSHDHFQDGKYLFKFNVSLHYCTWLLNRLKVSSKTCRINCRVDNVSFGVYFRYQKCVSLNSCVQVDGLGCLYFCAFDEETENLALKREELLKSLILFSFPHPFLQHLIQNRIDLHLNVQIYSHSANIWPCKPRHVTWGTKLLWAINFENRSLCAQNFPFPMELHNAFHCSCIQ